MATTDAGAVSEAGPVETGRLEVWYVDLVRSADALLARDGAERLVADDDRARANRLLEPLHCRERLAAHAALRLVLARHDGVAAGQPFERLASGKPVLAGHGGAHETGGAARLDFSLSHVDGVALIAVGRDMAVGIDVERVRPVAIEAPRRAVIEAAAESLPGAGPLPPPGDPRRLQRAWTRLEALAKARGVGMARTLAEIGVVGAGWGRRPEGEARARGSALVEAARSFCVRDLDCPAPDLLASIAGTSELPPPPGLRMGLFPVDARLGAVTR